MSDGRISWTWRHAIIKSDLKATTKHILLTLSCFMNDIGKGCYPTTKQLAEAASLSERATCEHLDIARQHGWITVKRHGFGGRKYRNHEYEASWPSASDSLTEDQQDEAQLTDPHAQLTDSDDNDSLTEGQSNVPSKAPDKDTSRKPKRISYPDDFQSFWKDYPTDKLMSKAEALKAWKKLSDEDKLLAAMSLTGFRRYCNDHPSYRTIHAERYLKQRRFDGFAPEIDERTLVVVEKGTPEFIAWIAHWRSLGVSTPFKERQDALTVESPFPPDTDQSRQQQIAEGAA